jgi:hypothetical protein
LIKTVFHNVISDRRITGYYATGADLTLVAITPPQLPEEIPAVHDIASANLRLRTDRIKNIRRLINLTKLFHALAELVPLTGEEYVTTQRFFPDFIQAV